MSSPLSPRSPSACCARAAPAVIKAAIANVAQTSRASRLRRGRREATGPLLKRTRAKIGGVRERQRYAVVVNTRLSCRRRRLLPSPRNGFQSAPRDDMRRHDSGIDERRPGGHPHHRQRAPGPSGARGGDPDDGGRRAWRRVLGSGQDDLGGDRPGHRDRHGQIGTHRAQDRSDARLDRRAGHIRPSGRGEPRRPRHGAERRRRAGHILVGRDGGTGGDRHLCQALRHFA